MSTIATSSDAKTKGWQRVTTSVNSCCLTLLVGTSDTFSNNVISVLVLFELRGFNYRTHNTIRNNFFCLQMRCLQMDVTWPLGLQLSHWHTTSFFVTRSRRFLYFPLWKIYEHFYWVKCIVNMQFRLYEIARTFKMELCAPTVNLVSKFVKNARLLLFLGLTDLLRVLFSFAVNSYNI